MAFADELAEVLPPDVPERETVIQQASAHLELIEEANTHFNLTRITSPREAAIKHVLDSLVPWRLFATARHVMDAGTGAGFPGIPLALALPGVRFTLSDSAGKKARFVEQAAKTLGVKNVKVSSARAEELLAKAPADVVTARAVAPLVRAIPLFARAIQKGSRLVLYKGRDIQREMADAEQEALQRKVKMRIAMTYELPEEMGKRTIVELAAKLPS